MSNGFIWPINRTQSGSTSPSKSGAVSSAIPQTPKLQHYETLAIKLFSIISRTSSGRDGSCYSSADIQFVKSTPPTD